MPIALTLVAFCNRKFVYVAWPVQVLFKHSTPFEQQFLGSLFLVWDTHCFLKEGLNALADIDCKK